MEQASELRDTSGRCEVLRWGSCFVLAAMLHAGGALALFVDRDRGKVSDFIPAVLMDFATLPVMDAPVRDIAPSLIEQVQTESAPTPAEAKPDQVQEAVPEKPTPVRLSEVRTEEAIEVKPVVEDPVPIRELPTVPDAEVTLATVIPPPPAQKVEEKEETEEKSEAQPTPPLATAPETTAPTAASVRTASLVSWKIRIATHLQRYKRYPPAAAARGEHGTAELRFTVDRNGHVLSAKLARGSGHALLDDETMALIHRAQPLPRPPGDVPGSDFSFTVPVQFNAK